MPVALEPATDDDVATYLIDAAESYRVNLEAAGVPASIASTTAADTFARDFPGGRAAPGHLVFRIEDEGFNAGLLWIGPQSAEQPQHWWVFDIIVAEARRGRGLGRQVMVLAEQVALRHGAVDLGLNVFGHNAVAVGLYQSLGYEMTSMRMRKALP
ncbi:GNAT family N-acetyltransferase [Mycobacterium yunnanensis]|uniref:GNAT family N-acetyltransferase n=1 Tax=Mycobacterium yunnanensis TaxID=368477 RepID=A0A9X2Z739_9MYCO|nr:GNAT family N-acetyltransferase [Mycobacterium yunnanensis]MCV7423526.1 GNAT family N-acetyltransferase [Mycobacterium yunnanensis]